MTAIPNHLSDNKRPNHPPSRWPPSNVFHRYITRSYSVMASCTPRSKHALPCAHHGTYHYFINWGKVWYGKGTLSYITDDGLLLNIDVSKCVITWVKVDTGITETKFYETLPLNPQLFGWWQITPRWLVCERTRDLSLPDCQAFFYKGSLK